MSKQGYIYILMNKSNTVVYIGVTSNLEQRVWQHKEKLVDGFTKKYCVDKLVYYEVFDEMYDAISREKQLKGWSRKKKDVLIQRENPELKDLFDNL